jgi:sterol desaturase/sphingolipid hydroxylase (fatty acid hydroxylase superfamily)
MHEWSFAELAAQQSSVFVPSLVGTMSMFFTMCVVQVWLAKRRGLPRGEAPPELRADFFWWLVNPVFRVVSRFIIVGIVFVAVYLLGDEFHPGVFDGFGPVMEQPKWLMIAELFVLTDLTSYWSHRLCHNVPFLWRFHAVHHSPKMVRWTSTARLHPVNELLTYCSNILPAMALGFPAYALGPFIPVIAIYALYSHSKWNHSLGPLRFILTGPLYHRWHHTYTHEGGSKNFSGVFAFWDLMFGTHYMPKGKVPEVFGLDGEEIPEDFWTQMTYPFRAPKPEPAAQRSTPSMVPRIEKTSDAVAHVE